MIAEPHICIKGKKVGQIIWCDNALVTHPAHSFIGDWKPYADFEREKLNGETFYSSEPIGIDENDNKGYTCVGYNSLEEICYTSSHYRRDSESSRLLKRAEFLKSVCEQEGIEWLPECPCNEKLRISCQDHLPYCEREKLNHLKQRNKDLTHELEVMKKEEREFRVELVYLLRKMSVSDVCNELIEKMRTRFL